MDENTSNPQQALSDKLKDTKNILVTVSVNPSVDQLASLLGLTLWLNKIGKHATAVFSGEVPSTLEFLHPAETLEKNTDSLRDFIISLDKHKADKLRYKVEDSVVKVFVTPYRTSLSAADLEFSQGDFNVDMVIALGVHKQEELDAAVVAHGRILHDATVVTITVGDSGSELGAINWHDAAASSLSEVLVSFANDVDKDQIDNQIATALLTGVVAETKRFSNAKTSPQTMSISAQLMSAGATQQLVATELADTNTDTNADVKNETSVQHDEQPVTEESSDNDGALPITHDKPAEVEPETEAAPAAAEPKEPTLAELEQMQPAPPEWLPSQPWMDHQDHAAPAEEPAAPEESTDEPTPAPQPPAVDAARDEVMKAIADSQPMPEPVAEPAPTPDLPPMQPAPTNFDPTNFDVHEHQEAPSLPPPIEPLPADPEAPAVNPNQPVDPDLTGPVEQVFTLPPPPPPVMPPPTTPDFDPTAPPPVPPPLPPQK